MKKILVITIFAIILSACGSLVPPPSSDQPTQDVDAIYTAAAQTMQAQLPTSIVTSTPVSDNATQPSVSLTSQPTAIVDGGCQDSAQYVGDDGKDGTTYAPNTPFTKTWRVKNTGTCTWNNTYVVSFVSGTAMTQSPWYMLVPAGNTVAPGDTIEVSIGATAPPDQGDYTSNWRIQNSAGTPLARFYLTLKVLGQTSGGITNVTAQIAPEQGHACDSDAIYNFTVSITSDGATTADYRIDLTDGSGQVTNGNFSFVDFISPEAQGSLTFAAAGTQQVILRALGAYSYPGQVTVRSLVNGQVWPAVTVACP